MENVMSGSMGKVYISEHLGWGVKIAIKSPRPEVLADREGMKRILKEANSWVRMGMHPNIASCYYVLGINKIPHLFIEYIDGGDLSEWIKAGRCRNLRTALTLAIQFCHGMEYTHKKGIIHRDIKPQNILITKNSLVKITDFGILLARGDKSEEGGVPVDAGVDSEATVGFRGTPGYASPEQLRNAHDVDRPSDIFSFGLCLWVMLCGKKPFINNAIEHQIPTPTPVVPGIKFPRILKDILVKSVAYNPQERYQNFEEMRHDLNEAYKAAFKTACPYAELSNIDLRADSLNNRAVSLFELGEANEALLCLQKTLEINDKLPEAVYNRILLQYRSGKTRLPRILRQIEAAKKSGAQIPWLHELETSVKKSMMGDKLDGNRKAEYPDLRLCIPKNSLEIFREGQLYLSIQRNVLDHLENKRYQTCHDVLMTAWKNKGFQKDRIFNKVYDQLLRVCSKKRILGVQRFLTLKATGSPATSLAYIPGTKKIVSAGPDGKIILRDFDASREVKIIGEEGLAVTAMAVCPKGKHLAVGTEDGGVTVYTAQSGNLISSGIAHNGATLSLAFDLRGRQLASGGADGIMKVRNLSAGPEKSIAFKEGGGVSAITFINKHHDMATGSDDGSIRLWEASGRECTKILEAHAMPVISLSPSIDGLRFASASKDRYLNIWDQQHGRCLKTIKAHEEAASSVLFLQDNRTVVSGCEDDIIKLWDSETGECLAILDGRGDGIYSLDHGPKPHTFLAGRKDGAIILWMIIYELQFN
ncbi:MAG: protein kinase [Desulfobulbaceae bacterium]|nr:protein kinase [Desulfobulbaceae bacterium]